jgi:glucosamine kinase
MTIPGPLLDGSRATGARYVAGVDGGATKTVAAVYDLETDRVSLGRGGPTNSDAVGVDAAVEALETALGAALAAAGTSGGELGTSVFGLAGTSWPELQERARTGFSLRAAYFINDVVSAWAAGTWLSPGVVVVSGTGSHVFAVDGKGASWRTGGWGHILGDEGSGYWLGLSGMKAALHARDASGPPTALLNAVNRFYELEDVGDLQGLVYGKPLEKEEIAAFATEVAAAARSGDAVALSLFDRAAHDLAKQARAPIDVLDFGDAPFIVALVGGVFASEPMLRDRIEREVLAFAPNAMFQPSELPPAAGSLLLALRAENAEERGDREILRRALAASNPVQGHA